MLQETHLDDIRTALEAGEIPKARRLLKAAFDAGNADNAALLCLQGRTFMKEAKWGEAMTCFLQAEDIDAACPAREYRSMLTEIMDFYNKDMYNQ